MAEKHQCAGQTFRYYHYYPCNKNGTLEHAGKMYCRSHHPPTVKARKDAKQKAWEDKWAAERKEREDAAKAQAELERKAAAFDWLEQHVVQVYDRNRMLFGRAPGATQSLLEYVEETRKAVEGD